MALLLMTVKSCGETPEGFVWVDMSTEDGFGVTLTLNFPYDAMKESLVGRKAMVKGAWGDFCSVVMWETV